MKPVASRHSQVLQADNEVDVLEFSDSAFHNLRRPAARITRRVELLGVSIRGSLDHTPERILSRDAYQGAAVLPPNAGHQLRDRRSINCMAWLATLVDMLSMTNLHNRYDKKLLFHFIYNSVHTLSDSVALLP